MWVYIVFKVPYFSLHWFGFVSNNVKFNIKKYQNIYFLVKPKYDPYFVATCFVVKKKRFEMYYTSNLLWQKIKGLAQPKYLIKNSILKKMV